MHKAAIIADDNLAPAFRALGFDAWSVSNPTQVQKAWHEAINGEYAIIFMTESIREQLSEQVSEFLDTERTLPLITVIPGREGSTGAGIAELKARVEKAIGVDILFKGEES